MTAKERPSAGLDASPRAVFGSRQGGEAVSLNGHGCSPYFWSVPVRNASYVSSQREIAHSEQGRPCGKQVVSVSGLVTCLGIVGGKSRAPPRLQLIAFCGDRLPKIR